VSIRDDVSEKKNTVGSSGIAYFLQGSEKPCKKNEKISNKKKSSNKRKIKNIGNIRNKKNKTKRLPFSGLIKRERRDAR